MSNVPKDGKLYLGHNGLGSTFLNIAQDREIDFGCQYVNVRLRHWLSYAHVRCTPRFDTLAFLDSKLCLLSQ